jgi:S-adenosylmethionine-dependent methyltransferase
MSLKTEAFSKTINQYLNHIKMPWGKLFYITAWHQISGSIETHNKLILDVGCLQ